MSNTPNINQYQELWTQYLDNYVLMEWDGEKVICNRETLSPLMIEDELVRQAVTQKMIEAGVQTMGAT